MNYILHNLCNFNILMLKFSFWTVCLQHRSFLSHRDTSCVPGNPVHFWGCLLETVADLIRWWLHSTSPHFWHPRQAWPSEIPEEVAASFVSPTALLERYSERRVAYLLVRSEGHFKEQPPSRWLDTQGKAWQGPRGSIGLLKPDAHLWAV